MAIQANAKRLKYRNSIDNPFCGQRLSMLYSIITVLPISITIDSSSYYNYPTVISIIDNSAFAVVFVLIYRNVNVTYMGASFAWLSHFRLRNYFEINQSDPSY